VREVGVHLEHEVGAGVEHPAEARQIGASQTLLARSVKDLHLGELGGELVGQDAGAVGRVVVDDQQVMLEPGGRELRENGPHERVDVLGLVVRREHKPGTGHGRVQ